MTLDHRCSIYSHAVEQGGLNARIATVLSIAFVSRSARSDVEVLDSMLSDC